MGLGSLRRARGLTRGSALRIALVAVVLSGWLVPNGTLAATGMITATSSLNIRACPSLECPVIGAASLGDPIEITGELKDGFYPVRWFDKDGFALGLFISKSGEVPWLEEGSVSCNRVALIFNIGIGNPPSQSVLNTLTQKAAPATMFPMGWWAQKNPAYLRQLDAAGFVIGTHGDQRQTLTGLSDTAIRTDVSNSVTTIESVLGRQIDEYFTPYADDINERVRQNVSGLGLLPVGWNVAAADYGTGVIEQYVYNRIMNGVYPGAIIEFHLDGPSTEQSTARALPRIVNDLRARGYALVTVPEMMTPCSPTTPPYSGTVSNTGGAGLRCRVAPTTAATAITTLGAGARVSIRSKAFNGWYPVTCAGQNGWISATYIKVGTLPPPTPSPTPTPTTPTPTPAPGTSGMGRVVNTGGAGLRCRTSPFTTSITITTLAEGSTVTLRGPAQNGWLPVRCASRDGWSSAAYISVTTTPPPSTATGYIDTAGGANANCRTLPSTAGAIITRVPFGTPVTIRGAVSNGWTPVRCANRDGWISSGLISATPP